MALIKCPDCGKMFSEFAECCPQCGCPVENTNAESDSNQMNFDAEKIEDNASLNNDSILSEDCIKTESDECISTVDETKAEQETNTSQRSSSSGSERLDQSQYSKEEKVIEPIINQSEKKAKKKIKYLLIGVLLGLGFSILSYVIYSQYMSSVEKPILQRAEYILDNIPFGCEDFKDAEKSIFSDSFSELLAESDYLRDRLEWADAWELEYHFIHQSEDGELKSMSLLSHNDTVAYVKIIYGHKEYEGYSSRECHIMKLVYNDGQWYCDDWDDIKDKLIEKMAKY